MADPTFDPNQPFQEIDESQLNPVNAQLQPQEQDLQPPAFDPSQPFEEVEQPDQDQDFAQRVGVDLIKRGKDFGSELNRIVTGDVFGSLKGKLPPGIKQSGQLLKLNQRLGGAVFGGAIDIINEGINSGVDAISSILPDGTGDAVKKKFVTSLDSILNQFPGGAEQLKQGASDAATNMADNLSKLAESSPEIARDLEDLGNVALLAFPGKGAGKLASGVAPKATILKKTANQVEKLAGDQRENFLLKLTRPLETKKQAIEEVGRSNINAIGTTKTIVSPKELAIAKELKNIKTLSPFRSFQFNFNQIAKTEAKVKRQVISELKKEGAIVKGSPFKDIVNKVATEVKDNPVLVGQKTVASRMVQQARRIMQKNGGTVSGLHKSRQEFDNFVRGLTSKNTNLLAVDTREQPRSIIAKTIRKVMNEAIDSSSGVNVKRLRKRQSLMIDGLKTIESKAAGEGKTIITRALKKAVELIPGRAAAINAVALSFGLSNLKATTKFAPVFSSIAVPAGVGLGLSKITMTPTAKRGVAKLIRVLDSAIKVTKSKEVLLSLKAERVALLRFAQGKNQQEKNNGN